MYNNIRKIQDIDLREKTVVVRTNYDVKLINDEIADNTKVLSSLPTIEHLLTKNCKIILISHMGEPKGQEDDSLSLMPIRFELGRLLNKPIKFAHLNACENSIKFMERGEILLLENLKFNLGEESKDEAVVMQSFGPLINLCDFYINDAFGIDQEYASMVYLPQKIYSFAGLGLQKELENLEKIQNNFQNPYVAILGGKESNVKLDLIESIVDKVDSILIGGELAYTFLNAQGVKTGKASVDDKLVKKADSILKKVKKTKAQIVLPIDHLGTEDKDEKLVEVDTQHLPKNIVGKDIGPKTLAIFREIIESAKTVFWNGSMGLFEVEQFSKGTEAIGEYIALSTPKDCFKIAGGEDTTFAMNLLKIKPKRFNHISTGGEMLLKYLGNNSFSVLNILTGEQIIPVEPESN
jgi:phosphoglycerate kinase